IAYLFGNGVPVDVMEAVYWLRRAANGNDASAQYFLGYVLLSGLVNETTGHQAGHWAAQLQAVGQAGRVTPYLLFPRGFKTDATLEEGLRWCKLSAEAGNRDACAFLGSRLVRDRADVLSFEEGVRLLRVAADGGSAEAEFHLGVLALQQ